MVGSKVQYHTNMSGLILILFLHTFNSFLKVFKSFSSLGQFDNKHSSIYTKWPLSIGNFYISNSDYRHWQLHFQ